MVAVARPLLPRLARLCTLAWCEAYVPRDELSEQEAEEQVESGEDGEKRGKRREEKWTTSDREQSAKNSICDAARSRLLLLRVLSVCEII
jgi:hypothetical protein